MDETMEQERQQALSQVNEALPIFERLTDLYLYAVNINEQFKFAQAITLRNSKLELLNAAAKKKLTAVIIGVISFVLLDFLYGMGVLPLSWAYLLFAIVIVCCIFFTSRYAPKDAKNHGTVSDELPSQEKSLYDADIRNISNEIAQTTIQNEDIINKIPRDYRNYDAVTFFEYALANQRAYSMKEAVNLYEQHLYRQRMEENSRQTRLEMEQQMRILQVIERASVETAGNTTYLVVSDILKSVFGS